MTTLPPPIKATAVSTEYCVRVAAMPREKEQPSDESVPMAAGRENELTPFAGRGDSANPIQSLSGSH